MAIKKTEIYRSLWASCDALRGGMDPSQYKDYVLAMLFIKYVSDKYAGVPFAPITVPEGASFEDMKNLRGSEGIGDQINKKIAEPLAKKNALTMMPDFNDAEKLGEGQDKIDRLTDLINIFDKPELDFSKNRAGGDDILGDAYEYLMRHFATESGKSKGQFYTPAEVSRLLAQIIGIDRTATTGKTTVYDPTCGSGSLLLKVSDRAATEVSLYGQERDVTTAGLAYMNMILHNNPKARIQQGNTLSTPRFLNDDKSLQTFDFIVANPPFSDKKWSTGLTLPADGKFQRFTFGNRTDDGSTKYLVPPNKNGDYAFLLHILKSLKRHGKAAVILPHGVLFRGNAEADIRRELVRRGYLDAIIGLPANLFYGTGIPAAILLLDKEDAPNRRHIFMVDASREFTKDGPKNRLRDRDIHRIAATVNERREVLGYSRLVPIEAEIAPNDYNLNLPRYLDRTEREDTEDIEAHLRGGIPTTDLDELNDYWTVFPGLRAALFAPADRPGYATLRPTKDRINETIFEHPEFRAYRARTDAVFADWRTATAARLKQLEPLPDDPAAVSWVKPLVRELATDLLDRYAPLPLLDKYDVYQHLLDYWRTDMEDDCYLISVDGWTAETYRILVERKKGKKPVDVGWTCDLVPPVYVRDRYFAAERDALAALRADKERIAEEMGDLRDTHEAEDGYFADFDKLNKTTLNARIKEIKAEQPELFDKNADMDPAEREELDTLRRYLQLMAEQTKTNKAIKTAAEALDAAMLAKYPELTTDDVKTLVVDDRWMPTLERAVAGEIDRVSRALTERLRTLAERYEYALPQLDQRAAELEQRVHDHLAKMGFVWK